MCTIMMSTLKRGIFEANFVQLNFRQGCGLNLSLLEWTLTEEVNKSKPANSLLDLRILLRVHACGEKKLNQWLQEKHYLIL